MLTGSCLCGAIAYEADAALSRIVHCHCQTCRKTHGAAFSSVTAVPRGVPLDSRQRSAGRFESSPGKLRRFCTRCGSHLMAERVAQPSCCCGWAASTRRSPTGRGHIWRSDGASWSTPRVIPGAAAGADMSPPDGGFLPVPPGRARAQALAGQRAEPGGDPALPARAASRLLPLLPYLFTATLDADGAPVASILSGRPASCARPIR